MNGVDASRSVAAGDSDLDGTPGRGDERRGEEVMSATEAGLRSVLAFCAHTYIEWARQAKSQKKSTLLL